MPGRKKIEISNLREWTYALMEQGPIGNPASRAINRSLVLVIVASVLTTILATVPAYQQSYGSVLQTIELAAFAVFAAEFSIRIWISAEHAPVKGLGPLKARLRYIASPFGLIDAATLLPFLLSFAFPADLKLVVLLRTVRLLKMTRYSPAMRSVLNALQSERRALVGCFVLIAIATILAAAVMHMAEADAQPDKFGTLPDSMWWAIVTLGTVGYGDAVPITAAGRLIASATVFVGVLMVALPIGIVATAFASEIHKRDFVVTWGLVARVPLFRELSASEIADIMRLLHAQQVAAGTIITRKGEQAHSMYLVAAGEVEIRLPGKDIKLGSGHFFGEIALLGHRHRSATVMATQATSLLVLEAHDLETLMENNPRIAERIQDVVRTRMGAPQAREEGGDIAKEELQDAQS